MKCSFHLVLQYISVDLDLNLFLFSCIDRSNTDRVKGNFREVWCCQIRSLLWRLEVLIFFVLILFI